MEEKRKFAERFLNAVIQQNASELKGYFHKNAIINWHCSNECFNVDEYIIANCEYPGKWVGQLERMEIIDELLISVAKVYLQDKTASFHVTSFIQLCNGKIQQMDEYWGDDGRAPKWRVEKKIGKPIYE